MLWNANLYQVRLCSFQVSCKNTKMLGIEWINNASIWPKIVVKIILESQWKEQYSNGEHKNCNIYQPEYSPLAVTRNGIQGLFWPKGPLTYVNETTLFPRTIQLEYLISLTILTNDI